MGYIILTANVEDNIHGIMYNDTKSKESFILFKHRRIRETIIDEKN